MADYLDVRASMRAFDTIAAHYGGRLDLTGGDAPEQVTGLFVTPNFFTVLGARPIAGRLFLPHEDTPNGERLLVLSEGLWRRRFNADPGSRVARSRLAASSTRSSVCCRPASRIRVPTSSSGRTCG